MTFVNALQLFTIICLLIAIVNVVRCIIMLERGRKR